MRKVLALVAAVVAAATAAVGLVAWRSYTAAMKDIPFDEPGGGW